MKKTRVLRTAISLALVLSMLASLALPYANADAKAAPKSIKITGKKEVAVSKTLKLKVSYTPKKAKSKIKWSTSNKTVATVSKSGVVTGKKAGTATITARTANKKTAKFTITVKSSEKYAAGTVLYDQSKEKKAKATPSKGYAAAKVINATYDSYKYHVCAIWLLPYNLYATGEKADDPLHGPANDVKGLRIQVTGEYKMDGADAEELLLQMNYTQPEAYPIVWQTDKNKGPVKGGKWYKVKVEFNVPKNSVNGDKDNGVGWPTLLYFANKPNNKMPYKKGNDFTFRKFKITVVGPATDDNKIDEKPKKPK